MFVHRERLRHLLTPAQYHAVEQHERERQHLFQPAWHLVASTAELPRPGDYLTLDLLDVPLAVRNIDGKIHTFLNACTPRRCQVPQQQFPTATCGELVFVSLTRDGPSLEEFLGPFASTCQTWFARPYGLKWTWQIDYQANWKVPVENSLESYHVPCLHARTFGTFPAEELCTHDLQESYTTFRTPEPLQWTTHIQRWFIRRLGLPQTGIYTQHHAHPHMTFAALDVFRLVQIFLPTSPTTCRHRVWLYTARGSGWNPWTRLLAATLSGLVQWVARQVVLEDAAIYPEVQRGLQASVFPGVLGTREERVFVFQEYVIKKCGDDTRTGQAALPAEQR